MRKGIKDLLNLKNYHSSIGGGTIEITEERAMEELKSMITDTLAAAKLTGQKYISTDLQYGGTCVCVFAYQEADSDTYSIKVVYSESYKTLMICNVSPHANL